jgi:hypothetical protein
MPDQNRSALFFQIGLGQRQRLVDPQPGAPEHHDQPVEAIAVPGVGSVAHDRDDLIDRWRVSRVALTLVPGCPPGVEVRQRRRRAAAAGSIEQLLSMGHGSLPWRAGRLTNQLYRSGADPSRPRSGSSAVARTAIPTTDYRILSKQQPAATPRLVGKPAARRPANPAVRRLTSPSRRSAGASSGGCRRPPRAARQLGAWAKHWPARVQRTHQRRHCVSRARAWSKKQKQSSHDARLLRITGADAGRGQILARRQKADEVLGDALRNALAGEADHSTGRSIGMMITQRLVGRGDGAALSTRRARRGADGIWPLMHCFPRLGHSRCIRVL